LRRTSSGDLSAEIIGQRPLTRHNSIPTEDEEADVLLMLA